jgi:uncharacterized membrane protein YcfT
MATAAVDAVGVVLAVAANDPRAQRRAAMVNATIDVIGAAALAIASRGADRPKRRLSALASVFLLLGAGAWLRGAQQLPT